MRKIIRFEMELVNKVNYNKLTLDFFKSKNKYYRTFDNIYSDRMLPIAFNAINNYYESGLETLKNLPLSWGYIQNINLLNLACSSHYDAVNYSMDEEIYEKYAQYILLIIRELLYQDSDYNYLNRIFHTPLEACLEDAYILLKSWGAKKNKDTIKSLRKQDYPYYLPYDLYDEIIAYPIKNLSLIDFNNQLQTLLSKKSVSHNIINLLKETEFSFNPGYPINQWIIDESGLTLLMHRIQAGDINDVEYLLGLDTPVNACDYKGYTALLYALMPQAYFHPSLSEPTARQIPAKYPEYRFEFADDDKQHWSLVNPKIIEVLLKAGADPNWLARYGETPLIFAVELGLWNIVQLLIQYGADINRQDQKKRTLLHVIIELLHERPLRFRQTFGEIVFHYGSERVFKYICTPDLPEDPDLEAAEEQLLASNRYTEEDIKKLLDLGANPHLKDERGLSPLDLARIHKPEWVKLLETYTG